MPISIGTKQDSECDPHTHTDINPVIVINHYDHHPTPSDSPTLDSTFLPNTDGSVGTENSEDVGYLLKMSPICRTNKGYRL